MRRVLIGVILLTVGATGSWAQDDGGQPGPPEQQPGVPERSVARISLLNGDASVRRGDSGDVVAAAVNAPLVLEDRLLTASSARAEVQFDAFNMLRLASNSEVRIGDLQYKRYQAQLAIGTVLLRVLRATDAYTELDTPILGVHPLGAGVYRVTVREDGSTDITVREGEAEIMTRLGNERLHAGSTMLARGTEADPEFRIVAEYGPDEFDRWNANRDQNLLRSQSRERVSPDIYGTEDLDGHGRWVNDPSYGQVWAPNVDPNWAPYQAGRWVWLDWYGWTWVSYDSWGWAPYHYGRWFYGSYGWCWFPGPGRHYWSPALVGFFGFGGGGVGVGFGFGNIGWAPLAPYERLYPWWGRGYYGNQAAIIGNTHIANSVNVTSVYRNARVANGVTSVGASSFGQVGGRFRSMSGFNVQNAGLVRGALPVSPNRSSLNFSDRQAHGTAVSQSRASGFYGRNPSAGTQRIPFEQQRQTMNQVARAPNFGGGSSAGAARTGGWRPVGQAPASGVGGWQSFGQPVHGARETTSAPAGSRGDQSAPSPNRSFGGSWGGSGQISRPMVHERPAAAPSGSGGSRSTAGGGSGSSSRGGSSGGSHRGK